MISLVLAWLSHHTRAAPGGPCCLRILLILHDRMPWIWVGRHRDDSQYQRGVSRQLRAEIGGDAGKPRDIATETGIGHRFADA